MLMMKSGIRYLIAAMVIAGAGIVATAAPAGAEKTPVADEGGGLDELSLEETLRLPQVPQKAKADVKAYMLREAKALQKLGYKVETMRHGEVVIATIPAEKLFAANDTALLPGVSRELDNFLPYFRTPGKFKVILAMHSDDTGSEKYLLSLTEKRIVALYDYFDSHAPATESLMGYPMGGAEPLEPNDNRARRNANRRLEIFIVPDGGVINQFGKTKK